MYYCILTILLICEPSLLNTYGSDKSLARHISEFREWQELRWDARIGVLTNIARAPKLQYRLEKMEVYRNGVWVDYSVTNLGSERKLVTPMFVDKPVRVMEAWDKDQRKWQIPQFEGQVSLSSPDTFVSIQPDSSIRFRSQMSPLVNKPLEPVDVLSGKKPERPKEVNYRILGWSHVYTKISEGGDSRESAYTIGFGKVPVRWHDEDSPKSWTSGTRLYGDDK